MAVDAPMLRRQEITAAAIETTTGTAIALDATHAVMNVFNSQMRATIPRNRRPGQGVSLGYLRQVPGARMGELTCETEVVGLGSSGSPLWATTFLLSAGFSQAVNTFTPQSGNASYATITAGLWQDGRFKSLVGGASDLVMRGTSGGPVMCSWRTQGCWVAPTATALVTPNYPDVDPPRLASATFTIGGAAYKLGDFELSLNNNIVMRPSAATASGYFAGVITDHDLTFKCNLEAAVAKDFYADHLAGTEAALNLVIGATANNIITITAPKMQLADPPEDVDAGGLLQDGLTFQLNKSVDAGEDMLSIAFT
jgi:hypothetical protein